MRILSVSTSDRGGGAEQVAWDLFTGLEEHGHESWLAVGEKHTSHPNIFEIHASPYFDYRPYDTPELQAAWEKERKERRERGGEDFVHPYSHRLLELTPEPPDAVVVHNLHGGYFDLRSFPGLTRKVPVVAVLHDYWMLTGHCAYPFDCERWREGCGECPDLTIPPAIQYDATRGNLRLKRSIYEQSDFTVCSPSKRLIAEVDDSVLKKGASRLHCIPNGSNLNLFHPGDSGKARNRLGLPQDSPIILMLAKNVETNRFKDYHCAEECLRIFEEEGRSVGFVFLGGSEEPTTLERGSVTVFKRPYTDDRKTVADYFRAADVLLHATRQEVAPLVLTEALASGLPSVASATGNSAELLGGGGVTVPPGDAKAHVAALRKLLDTPDYRVEMGKTARVLAEQSGGREAMISSYENLLRDLTDSYRSNARL